MKSWKLFLYRLISCLLPETRCFPFKACLLRWCGAKIGRNVRINSSAHILGVGSLEIGDDVWIGNDVILMPMSPARISIGSCVDIAPGVYLSTGSHLIDAEGSHSAGSGFNLDIVVGRGVWLGARSVVLPGVTIGEKSIIGAAALVTRDVPSRVIAYGVPSRIARSI